MQPRRFGRHRIAATNLYAVFRARRAVRRTSASSPSRRVQPACASHPSSHEQARQSFPSRRGSACTPRLPSGRLPSRITRALRASLSRLVRYRRRGAVQSRACRAPWSKMGATTSRGVVDFREQCRQQLYRFIGSMRVDQSPGLTMSRLHLSSGLSFGCPLSIAIRLASPSRSKAEAIWIRARV